MSLIEIGKRIEKLRINSNLSRKTLSEYLEISEEELEKIELGKMTPVKSEIISKIADLYFCREDYITDGIDKDYIEIRVPFDYADCNKCKLDGMAKVFGAVREKQKIGDVIPDEEFRKQMYSGLNINSEKKQKTSREEIQNDDIFSSGGNYISRYNNMTEEEKQKEFEDTMLDEYFFNDYNPFGL